MAGEPGPPPSSGRHLSEKHVLEEFAEASHRWPMVPNQQDLLPGPGTVCYKQGGL